MSETQVDEVEKPQADAAPAKKAGCCGKKPQELTNEQKQIVDPAEPKLTILHQLRIVYAVGFTWIFIFFGAIFSAVNGVIPLLFYLVMGDLLDALSVPGATKDTLRNAVNRLALNLLYIAIGSGVASGLGKICLDTSFEVIGIKLKRLYFERLLTQEMGFFDIKKSGALASVISDEVQHCQDSFAVKMPNVAQFGAQTIAGIILAFTSSWKMTLIMLASAPVLMVILMVAGTLMKMIAEKTSQSNQQAFACATEVLSSMRTVRSMAGEEKETSRFHTELSKITKFGIAKGVINSFGFGLIIFAIWADAALAFFYGGTLVADGEITIGAMMKVFGMMLFAVLGASQAFAQAPDIIKAIGSAKNILKVVLREPQIRFNGGSTLQEIKGDLTFENVKFSYPSRPDVVVLHDFNFSMQAGKKYALVGHSGSGKSTILGLLERFYEPSKTNNGKILLDGHNLADLDPIWLHQHVIGIVTQEPTLFNCSIRDNIVYGMGKVKMSQQQIEDAAKVAFAHDFIMKLPNGYDTLVGERGASLSGGQKQRVAIARAILQNPKILLLDEATSALDTESEKFVQEALNHLMKGRTSVVIAHRLSTILDSDCIIVMDGGIVKEIGTHNDLIKNPQGAYYKLAEKQMVVAESTSFAPEPAETTHVLLDADVKVSAPSDNLSDVHVSDVQNPKDQ